MLAWLSNPDAQLILISPTILEIVLGAGNIFFISILSGKLPAEQRARRATPASRSRSPDNGWSSFSADFFSSEKASTKSIATLRNR